MKRDHQQIFNTCCRRRLQQYTDRIVPDATPQAIAQARYLAAYLDQWCLSLASKRLLRSVDLCSIARLPQNDLLREVPQRPVWIAIDLPLSQSGNPCLQSEMIAAAFFYALECPFVLQHACVPPAIQRSWRRSDPPTPAWWEWQLDLIADGGDVLSEYLFTYDARTAQWRKMAGSTCLWEQCHSLIDQQLVDDPVVHICQNCWKLLKDLSSWLSTILNLNLGQKIFLDNIDFDIWKRRVFTS